MVEKYDKFIPVYEEISKIIKIFPTIINKEDILKMAEDLGFKLDIKSGRFFITGLEKYFRKFKIFAYESETEGKRIIVFKKFSEEDEKYLEKIENVFWILTADLINDVGGIIIQRELYEKDDIVNALGKFEEYSAIILNLQLYIEEFEMSELMWDANNLMERYKNSLYVILYKKFGKLTETESKEYLYDTKQLIESRLMPMTKQVEILKGRKVVINRQIDIKTIAQSLKNLLASL